MRGRRDSRTSAALGIVVEHFSLFEQAFCLVITSSMSERRTWIHRPVSRSNRHNCSPQRIPTDRTAPLFNRVIAGGTSRFFHSGHVTLSYAFVGRLTVAFSSMARDPPNSTNFFLSNSFRTGSTSEIL